MSLLSNPVMWQHQHTYAHHSHTNSFDHDPDLHHFARVLRVHWRFQPAEHYKYQSNWMFVMCVYALVCVGTCFWIPLGLLREGNLYGIVEWSDRGRRPWLVVGLCLHLVVYVCCIMIWPFFVHSHWSSALAAATVHMGTSGLVFAIFSQINHLNEASLELPEKRRDRHADHPVLRDSWAVAQVETSNNFCPGSTVCHILSNGLNLQIEHHLFPGLNHCHLPLIQATVQATCEEYGVCYKSYHSWSDLMGATLAWLSKLSVEPPDRV
jgi:fatty acid desaturase